MKKKNLNIARNLSFLILGILILFLTFKGNDISKVADQIVTANYFWIVFAKIFSLTAHVMRAARWNLLINAVGYNPRLRNSFYAVMTGYLANLAIPRFGEFVRCWSLKKTDDIPVDLLLGTVIIERVIDVMMLMLIILSISIIKINLLGNFLLEGLLYPFYLRIQSILVRIFTDATLLFVGLMFTLILVFGVIKFYKQLINNDKVKNMIMSFIKGLKAIIKMKNKQKFIAFTLLIWAMYILGFYMCFFALQSTSNIGFVNGILIFALSSLGMIAPVQAGIGAFHWLVAQGLVLLKVEMEEGIAFATIVHGFSVLFILILGIYSLIMVFIQGKASRMK